MLEIERRTWIYHTLFSQFSWDVCDTFRVISTLFKFLWEFFWKRLWFFRNFSSFLSGVLWELFLWEFFWTFRDSLCVFKIFQDFSYFGNFSNNFCFQTFRVNSRFCVIFNFFFRDLYKIFVIFRDFFRNSFGIYMSYFGIFRYYFVPREVLSVIFGIMSYLSDWCDFRKLLDPKVYLILTLFFYECHEKQKL